MALLLGLERRFGRARHGRWAPRTLDLDLLLYGDYIIHERTVTLPHPRIQQRRFVLVPLAELNPRLVFPGGLSVAQALLMTEAQEVSRW